MSKSKKKLIHKFEREVIVGYTFGFLVCLLLLILFGIFVCVFSYYHYTQEENNNIQVDLDRAGKQIVHNFELSTVSVIIGIETIRGLYYASPNFDKEDFITFLRTTDSERSIGIKNVMWSKKLYHKDRPVFEDDLKKMLGRDNFSLVDWDSTTQSFIPSPKRYTYFPILYEYSKLYTNNFEFVGLDISSDKLVKEGLIRAINTNKPAVELVKTVFLRPMLLNEVSIDILIMIPVFQSIILPESYEEKFKDVVGFSMGIFVIDDMIKTSRKEVDYGRDFYIFMYEPDGQVIYQQKQFKFNNIIEVGSTRLFDRRLKYESKVNIADKTYYMLFITTTEYENEQRTCLPAMVSIVSFAIICLSIFYLVDQRRKRNTINKMVHEKSELINKILPLEVSVKLESGEDVVAERSNNACVFFLDIAGFTRFSSIHTPEQVIQVLIKIFNSIDNLCAIHGIEKIKTIGDAYMATSGLSPKYDNLRENTEKMLTFGLDVLKAIPKEVSSHFGLKVRVGIHCGPVISGVISGAKPHFDVWGDTVNVASRMESTGFPGNIHVSDRVYQLTKDNFEYYDHCDVVQVKGKGKMKTWYLIGKIGHPELSIKKEFQKFKQYIENLGSGKVYNGSPHYHYYSPTFPGNFEFLDIDHNSSGNEDLLCERCGSTNTISSPKLFDKFKTKKQLNSNFNFKSTSSDNNNNNYKEKEKEKDENNNNETHKDNDSKNNNNNNDDKDNINNLESNINYENNYLNPLEEEEKLIDLSLENDNTNFVGNKF
eukprot:gene1250-1577_t